MCIYNMCAGRASGDKPTASDNCARLSSRRLACDKRRHSRRFARRFYKSESRGLAFEGFLVSFFCEDCRFSIVTFSFSWANDVPLREKKKVHSDVVERVHRISLSYVLL